MKRSLPAWAAIALAFACGGGAAAQGGIDFSRIEIRTVRLADNVHVLVASPAMGNVLVLSGPDGVLLVDSMYPQMHDKLMAAVRQISPGPIRYVINTHLHGDHTGGNGALAKAGATIVAQDNVRRRMLLAKAPPAPPGTPAYPPGDGPALTYGDRLTLQFDGEEVDVIHPAPAHTDGDSIVWLRHADVMHVGDLPATLRFNNLGVDDGGSIDGMIADGKLVLSLVNPGTRIVAGHLGPLASVQDIQAQEVMFQTVRDRVAAMVMAGKTLDEAVAAKPTRDFDEGRLGGQFTPDRFVALVYTDLSRRLRR